MLIKKIRDINHKSKTGQLCSFVSDLLAGFATKGLRKRGGEQEVVKLTKMI